jgi:hypothetical protein
MVKRDSSEEWLYHWKDTVTNEFRRYSCQTFPGGLDRCYTVKAGILFGKLRCLFQPSSAEGNPSALG